MQSRSALWRELHLSLERIYSDYSRHGRELVMPVLSGALNPDVARGTVEAEIARRRLKINLAADWPEFERLRAECFDSANLGTAEAPFESVYQAACFFRGLGRRYSPKDDYWFYRGQRDHRWDCIPKIMRTMRDLHTDRRQVELAAGLRSVRSLVSRIKRAGLANNDFDATAIAQHYSSELTVGTWLVDVTSSPWVALFFASDGGRTGDIGTVDLISRNEWQRFSGNGTTALGALRMAELKSIPRINNQAGFFLQAPHPDLFNQLYNQRRHFVQEDGVVFESPLLEPPIKRAWIYPDGDETLDMIRAVPHDEAAERSALDWEPSASAVLAPDWEVYLPIARALFEDHQQELPHLAGRMSQSDWDRELEKLCRFHAAIYAGGTKVSLHHLDRAVGRMMA